MASYLHMRAGAHACPHSHAGGQAGMDAHERKEGRRKGRGREEVRKESTNKRYLKHFKLLQLMCL